MLKKELRTLYLNKRIAITKPQYWADNKSVLAQLKHFNWNFYTFVSIFLPIKNLNEVDTFEILTYFSQNHPQLKICIPKTNLIDYSLQHLQYTEETVLIKNKYNIPEPLYGTIILSSQIDVVFVPLLAYDLQGFRVGYGKGIYDRFLATCKSNVVKIGLSFFDAEKQITDINAFDIKLTNCITPHKIYTF